MQLWTNFLDWLTSDEGWRITSSAIIPFLAIVIAAVIAAAIGRGSARRIVALSDRDLRFGAVSALVSAARKAAVWNTLRAPEQNHIDQLISEADIRVRLLSTTGSTMAADWAAHEIAEMKKNAVSFSFQAEQSLGVLRDRLIEWQAHPSRAKRLFRSDLEVWAYEDTRSDQELVQQQQAWAAQQAAESSSRANTAAAAGASAVGATAAGVAGVAGTGSPAAGAPSTGPTTEQFAPSAYRPVDSTTSTSPVVSTTHAEPTTHESTTHEPTAESAAHDAGQEDATENPSAEDFAPEDFTPEDSRAGDPGTEDSAAAVSEERAY